jgi:hypothetical protein
MQLRFFKIVFSDKWKYGEEQFFHAENHKKAIEKVDKQTKRINNKRFREIEKIGQFYYVTENIKNGKTFIFEKISKYKKTMQLKKCAGTNCQLKTQCKCYISESTEEHQQVKVKNDYGVISCVNFQQNYKKTSCYSEPLKK